MTEITSDDPFALCDMPSNPFNEVPTTNASIIPSMTSDDSFNGLNINIPKTSLLAPNNDVFKTPSFLNDAASFLDVKPPTHKEIMMTNSDVFKTPDFVINPDFLNIKAPSNKHVSIPSNDVFKTPNFDDDISFLNMKPPPTNSITPIETNQTNSKCTYEYISFPVFIIHN